MCLALFGQGRPAIGPAWIYPVILHMKQILFVIQTPFLYIYQNKNVQLLFHCIHNYQQIVIQRNILDELLVHNNDRSTNHLRNLDNITFPSAN